MKSCALPGLGSRRHFHPRACARGYILTPLRGWAAAISRAMRLQSKKLRRRSGGWKRRLSAGAAFRQILSPGFSCLLVLILDLLTRSGLNYRKSCPHDVLAQFNNCDLILVRPILVSARQVV